ncbi:MAG: S41 family peptidase [Bacillota bacterium]
MKRRFWAAALSTAAACLLAVSANAQAPGEGKPMLAQPSLSPDGQMVAFASGGDIWEAPAQGGVAHLLVSGPADDSRPLYSPDGRRLAFNSTRGGSSNIYVLDLTSGAITRLTYADANEQLDGWSGDGRWVYFTTNGNDAGRRTDIMRVASTGGTPGEISAERFLNEFESAASRAGDKVAFAAFGISGSQWWRNGSSHIDQAQLWMKSIDQPAGFTRLAADPSRHAWPMFDPSGQSVIYMSDAGGAENLWRLALAPGAQPQKLTNFTDGRLLYPTIAHDGSAIVFERGMQVWRLDLASGQAGPVPLTLRGAPADDTIDHQRLDRFTRLAASPDGKKIAVIGHGELFATTAKDGGPAQRITRTVGAEDEVTWSPDSRRLLYVTERGTQRLLAEYDVAAERETLLTSSGNASVPVYSPDGKSIVYVANDRELHRLTLPRPGVPLADRLLFSGEINTDGTDGPAPVWSPDGAWIAFPLADPKSFTRVAVIPATGGTPRSVSFLANGNMSKINWSPDGKYLLFDSGQRNEQSRIVRVDLVPHVPKYREDMFRDLFAEKSPGETKQEKKDKGSAPDAAKEKAPAPEPVTPVSIAWNGLRDRATFVPVGLDASSPLLSPDGKTMYFIASSAGQDNIYSYSLDELASDPPVAQQITSTPKPKRDLALAPDGKTLFYLEGGKPMSTPLDTPKPKAIPVDASLDVDFDREKQVVFDEAWSTLDRRFYDGNFHGQDWNALRAETEPYVQGARTPQELRRAINLMIGELNSSHSGINPPSSGPGSLPTDRVGELAVRFDRNAIESGRGLVVSDVIALGPADVAGIRAGDRITSVDGVPVTARSNIDALLENKVGARVPIGIARGGTARQVVVQPVSASTEAGLAYRDWVESRRALVDRLSGGRLGYVHMADMSADSLEQLYIDLDAENESKQGVVIDVRNNNGGFVNGHAIDVFARRNYLRMTPRDRGTFPSRQALGQRALGLPTVLVTNESSLSDAEDFTQGYRSLGLGKVVGEPTAGWIIFTGAQRLIDGSSVRVPFIRIQTTSGEDMEGHPRPVDVEVERPLGESETGQDAQLAAAVQTLLGQIDAAH